MLSIHEHITLHSDYTLSTETLVLQLGDVLIILAIKQTIEVL